MGILHESIEKRPETIYGTFGAENRGRTDTMFPSRDFKSLASAYSAIPAYSVLLAFLTYSVTVFAQTPG